MEYTVIKSKRRTFALQIRDGELIVRCPLRATRRQIELFLRQNGEWIARHMEKARKIQKDAGETLTESELKALRDTAKQVIPEKVRRWAAVIGVSFGRISIRCQHTRWGSCSSRGDLNFNCLLMLCPEEVLDSVIVHELCHRKEMNHSERFYAEVLRAFPDYGQSRKWLRENGPALLARLPRK